MLLLIVFWFHKVDSTSLGSRKPQQKKKKIQINFKPQNIKLMVSSYIRVKYAKNVTSNFEFFLFFLQMYGYDIPQIASSS